MRFYRWPDWKLITVSCQWYCQTWSTEICWKWCRNEKNIIKINNNTEKDNSKWLNIPRWATMLKSTIEDIYNWLENLDGKIPVINNSIQDDLYWLLNPN